MHVYLKPILAVILLGFVLPGLSNSWPAETSCVMTIVNPASCDDFFETNVCYANLPAAAITH